MTAWRMKLKDVVTGRISGLGEVVEDEIEVSGLVKEERFDTPEEAMARANELIFTGWYVASYRRGLENDCVVEYFAPGDIVNRTPLT